MIDSIAQIGLRGIEQGFANAARNSEAVIEAYRTGADAIGPLVGLKTDQLQVQASAKVIRVADQLQGSILDIIA